MARSQLPTCSTFQWVTADWWNGPWDEELDEMDTTEEGVEFIMTPLLLLRTTPLLLPSGVTTALVGLDDRIELLICGSRTPRPSSARHLPSRMDRTRWAGAAAGRVSAVRLPGSVGGGMLPQEFTFGQ